MGAHAVIHQIDIFCQQDVEICGFTLSRLPPAMLEHTSDNTVGTLAMLGYFQYILVEGIENVFDVGKGVSSKKLLVLHEHLPQLLDQLQGQVRKVVDKIQGVAHLMGDASRQDPQRGKMLLHEQLILRLLKLPQGVFQVDVVGLEFPCPLFDLVLQGTAVVLEKPLHPLLLGDVPDNPLVAQNPPVRSAPCCRTHVAMHDRPIFLAELQLIVVHGALALDGLLEAQPVIGIDVGLLGIETDHLGPGVAKEFQGCLVDCEDSPVARGDIDGVAGSSNRGSISPRSPLWWFPPADTTMAVLSGIRHPHRAPLDISLRQPRQRRPLLSIARRAALPQCQGEPRPFVHRDVNHHGRPRIGNRCRAPRNTLGKKTAGVTVEFQPLVRGRKRPVARLDPGGVWTYHAGKAHILASQGQTIPLLSVIAVWKQTGGMADANRLSLRGPALNNDASFGVDKRIEGRRGDDAKMAAEAAFIKPDRADARAGGDDLADVPHPLAGVQHDDDRQRSAGDAVLLFGHCQGRGDLFHVCSSLSPCQDDSRETGPGRGHDIGVRQLFVDAHKHFSPPACGDGDRRFDIGARTRLLDLRNSIG